MTGLLPAVSRALPDEHTQTTADDRMRDLLSAPEPGPIGERLALLHFTGRRSGRGFVVPAGLHELDGRLVVATGSSWRHNFAGGAPAEVTWRGRRGPAVLRLIDAVDPVTVAYHELIRRYGSESAQRRLGLVITVDRTPTVAEVRDAVVRHRLALVELDISTSPSKRTDGSRT